MEQTFGYVREGQTRADYWEKRLTEFRGLDGVGFIGYGAAFNSWMYRARERVFRKQLSSLPLDFSQVNVLDIGSGTGYWVEVWKSLGVNSLTASDITEIASSKLAQRYPEYRVERLDISSAEVPAMLGGTYQAVSAIDILFHITSDEAYSRAISNIGRLLKAGGYFVFTENLPHNPMVRADSQVNRTLDEVSGELRRCGLRVVKRIPLFVIMNTPFDSKWKQAAFAWRLLMRPLRIFPFLGHLYGAVLFPVECFFQGLAREGPSTELVICQKDG